MTELSLPGGVLSLLLALLVVVTVLPFWGHRSWIVRGLDFPRVQFFWVAAVLLLLTPTVSAMPLTIAIPLCVVALLCGLVHARYLFPFSPLANREVPDAPERTGESSMRLMIANVLMVNENSESLLAEVRCHQPDVLLTLETNSRWEKALADLAEPYPYRVAEPLDNLYGMHLFSRLPLVEVETRFLVEDDVPSIHTLIELPSGATVRAHFLHPAPPSPTENDSSEERDTELTLVAKSLEEDDLPVVVAGDLNDVSWSRNIALFKRISELGDVRVGRGLYSTFNAKYRLLRWPLDHLFVSSHFQVSQLGRISIRGSDHFALLAEIVLGTENEIQSSTESLSAHDKKDVAETLKPQDANVSDVPEPDQ